MRQRETTLFTVLTVLLTAVAVLGFVFAPVGAAATAAALLAAAAGTGFLLFRRVTATSGTTSFATEELTAITEGLHDPVIVYDPNFVLIRMNHAAETFFQVTMNEVVGTRVEPGMVKNPHLRSFIQTLFPTLAPSVTELSDAGSWPQVVAVTLEDPRRELVCTLHRIADPQGTTTGFIKIVHDRTHEQAILEAKSEFISVAAHQLRTPLTAINWSLETIRGTAGLPAEVAASLAETAALAQRSLKITNDLLDASKIEEGKFGYQFKESDLAALIRQVLGEASVEAKKFHIGVFFNPPAAPLPPITMDTSRIGTVLSNLVDNALRYNVENGKVTVSVTEVPGQPYVRVVVEDTGVGVPADEVSHLFKKLQRGSNVAAIAPDGSGLGLYIAKNIVRRHGGDIGVESVENRGSTFWFTLPTDPARIPPKEQGTEE